MGVRVQVGDDLVGRDAEADSLPDGISRETARDHVGEAHVELAEEGQDGDLERRGGVGIDAVISLDDDAFGCAGFVGRRGAGRAAATGARRRRARFAGGISCCRLEGRGDGAQGRGGAGQGCGETGREELPRVTGDIDQAEVDERGEHVAPSLRQGRGVVGGAELERGKHK